MGAGGEVRRMHKSGAYTLPLVGRVTVLGHEKTTKQPKTMSIDDNNSMTKTKKTDGKVNRQLPNDLLQNVYLG